MRQFRRALGCAKCDPTDLPAQLRKPPRATAQGEKNQNGPLIRDEIERFPGRVGLVQNAGAIGGIFLHNLLYGKYPT